jgi:hypothetical protein
MSKVAQYFCSADEMLVLSPGRTSQAQDNAKLCRRMVLEGEGPIVVEFMSVAISLAASRFGSHSGLPPYTSSVNEPVSEWHSRSWIVFSGTRWASISATLKCRNECKPAFGISKDVSNTAILRLR